MSKVLDKKIDFKVYVSVCNANPNGDPLNGNRPRQDYDGYGEMSDVCIKRKIRNRMQDLGYEIFVKADDRIDDDCYSTSARAKNVLGDAKDREEYVETANKSWMDVRSFGSVFAFSDKQSFSAGIRGPVTFHLPVSLAPVEVKTYQITRATNAADTGTPGVRASDTIGEKHIVKFGLYEVKGSITVQLAEKTGFTHDDAEELKECLRTLFVNDASSARPDGSMVVERVYWWEHNCKIGVCNPRTVHNSVQAVLKDPSRLPKSMDDYEFQQVAEIPGVTLEVIEGF